MIHVIEILRYDSIPSYYSYPIGPSLKFRYDERQDIQRDFYDDEYRVAVL